MQEVSKAIKPAITSKQVWGTKFMIYASVQRKLVRCIIEIIIVTTGTLFTKKNPVFQHHEHLFETVFAAVEDK